MTERPRPTRVLFVCLGNICRSPSAEGVFRAAVARAGRESAFEIDSAGTGAWHVGEPPDRRAQAAAKARGVDISRQRARQVSVEDFERFDLILAMDRSNLAALERLRPTDAAPPRLMLDYAAGASTREVPDPYYGDGDGFERVLDLLEAASEGLLAATEASKT